MRNNISKKNASLAWVAIIGLIVTLFAPAGLAAAGFSSPVSGDSAAGSSSPVSDDSSVGNDSSVGSDSSVADDSSVASDSPVADDSSVDPDSDGDDTGIRLQLFIRVVNDNGGTLGPEDFTVDFWFDPLSATLSDGDETWLEPGEEFRVWARTPTGYSYSDVYCYGHDFNDIIEIAVGDLGVISGHYKLSPDVLEVDCEVTFYDRQPQVFFDLPYVEGESTFHEQTVSIKGEVKRGTSPSFRLDAGTYPVDVAVDGYTLDQLDCSSSLDASRERYFPLAPDGETLTVRVGQNVFCGTVFVPNPETGIKIVHNVANDDGGTATSEYPTATLESLSGNSVPLPDDTYIEVDAGTYQLDVELAGYTTQLTSCTDDITGAEISLSAGEIVITDGANIVCEANHDDIPARVLFDTNFSYGSPDARLVFGDRTVRAGQFRVLPAGQYPTTAKHIHGYTFTGVTCVDQHGNTQSAPQYFGSIDLENGDFYTCTYSYEAKPIRVLFQVAVINDNNGALDQTSPRITFGHVTTRHNQFRVLPAGDYDLGASVPDGYELTATTCEDRYGRPVIMNGNTVEGTPKLWLTCTYTFNDLP